MNDQDQVLRDKTYKGQCDDDVSRVFCTLSNDKDSQTHRNSKLLASLVDHLLKRGLITQEQLDEILLSVIT